MSNRVRVLLHTLAPDEGPDGLVAAYHRISEELSGTPGLLGNELMHSVLDPGAFVVMSEWESLAAFRAWEEGAAHRPTTAPLRPYQDRRRQDRYGMYEVVARY
ncbi:antibiotic biosynthesis monooxygenase family protein [Sphaerisporangium dianthi]|uniref:Antibiotic biosynthesis monooxygenase family protein n=1 Tax=Sphaerisporangium dianthi TaxID=1436120 RepID=A0ABV9CJI3_9ACTN